MPTVFELRSGNTLTANGKPILKVAGVLSIPFHVEVEPLAPNARRVDVNQEITIPVEGDTVYLKVGEPMQMDPEYSVMITRIYNKSTPACRLSIRHPEHVEVRMTHR